MGMIKRFFKEEEGLATLEIILIVVVLVGLVFLFRKQLTAFFDAIMQKIQKLVTDVTKDAGTTNK